jgi:Ran GTPase-activating protein (RanGAP) involved in mRNA processing and transport
MVLPGIALVISQSDSITEVDLTANAITADGIKTLQEALIQSQSVTNISFAQNDLGDDGCLQVILALRNNRPITHVNLSDTGMSHNALTVLGALIGQIHHVTCLYVDNPHNGIDGDTAAKRLFLSLCDNRSVSELSIARAKLGDDSAFLIGEALYVNITLKALRLRANDISSIGAEKLCKALAENTTLEVLDISGNKIGDKGAEAFAAMLKKNSKLAKLDLQSNGIHGVGLLALCNALPQNAKLAELTLWGNHFVDDSVKVAWGNMIAGPRGNSIKLDFLVTYTESTPYIARKACVDSPQIWPP